MPFRMASPEELENAAELNSDAAKALEEEAGVLEERGYQSRLKESCRRQRMCKIRQSLCDRGRSSYASSTWVSWQCRQSLISFRYKQTGLWEGYIQETFRHGLASTAKCDV